MKHSPFNDEDKKTISNVVLKMGGAFVLLLLSLIYLARFIGS
jgi:hypothetical protein